MKNLIRIVLLVVLVFNITMMAQTRYKISTEPVTPHGLSGITTNSVSAGLDIVPNGTFVYLAPKNMLDTLSATTATFSIVAQPAGSNVTLTTFNGNWVYFQPMVKGDYTIRLQATNAKGSHDTTLVVTAADWVGVGGFEGVAGTGFKCMTCHAGTPKFKAIYDKWVVSGHAVIFKREVEINNHYGPSCMKCHTTGYDHNVAANNNGFDDIATTLGWKYFPPAGGAPNPTKWDSTVTLFPGLVNHATIGCEMCHGAGSEHVAKFGQGKIEITADDGACAQCHDEPWRHNKVAQYENSLHSEAIWSSSFAQSTGQNNTLANCIRCHSATGFINFTKGQTTNTTGMVMGDHEVIGCATCHDPHGNDNLASLRLIPAASDTLGNGFVIGNNLAPESATCGACHKARRDVTAYTRGAISRSGFSHWGPHHSVQTDVLLGKNGALLNGVSAYKSGNHASIGGGCVGCHMQETVDTSDHANRDKVGGHSFTMKNEATGYEHVTSCQGCHGSRIQNFESFEADSDLDGNGSVGSIQTEVSGLITKLDQLLPDTYDSVFYSTVKARQALWNYQLIAYDGSKGMHNPKFAVDVLTQTIVALGGTVPVQLTSLEASVNNSVVTLAWQTATETNNKGFEVERKSGNNWIKVGFVNGKGTNSEISNYSFSDRLNNVAEGIVVYRIKQLDFDGTFSLSKEVSVNYDGGPKTFALMQNYPNPFNPSTTIKFALPFTSKVKVSVYNVTGQLVKELVNEVREQGTHEVKFDATLVNEISSGIYFYSIDANAVDGGQSFRATKKMVLVK